jgi:tetratricopeptide (TPR) repeat protein
LLEQAVAHSTSLNQLYRQSLWGVFLSETYLRAGRLHDALPITQHALDQSRERKEQGHQDYALYLVGDIAMHHDPPEIDQAETHYHQALTLANKLGMRPLQAHCHRALGILYRHAGQCKQAHAELSTAIEVYRDMEMTFWLPETEAALTELQGKA